MFPFFQHVSVAPSHSARQPRLRSFQMRTAVNRRCCWFHFLAALGVLQFELETPCEARVPWQTNYLYQPDVWVSGWPMGKEVLSTPTVPVSWVTVLISIKTRGRREEQISGPGYGDFRLSGLL